MTPPIWLRGYGAATLRQDAVAGLVVVMMLVPQSLAYALLAGLPAETGLFASILPLIAYALFGSSRTMAATGAVSIIQKPSSMRTDSKPKRSASCWPMSGSSS